MELNICKKHFDSEEIVSIRITKTNCMVDTGDDFFNFKYKSESEIRDARFYLKLQSLTYKDLYDAITTLVFVCNYYINSKNQCQYCPLHKQSGCLIQTIPINWD
jgi:hypothetical protein